MITKLEEESCGGKTFNSDVYIYFTLTQSELDLKATRILGKEDLNLIRYVIERNVPITKIARY